jgi:hypothetical protein
MQVKLRGSHIAHQLLFMEEATSTPVIPIDRQQGRNPDLNDKRNDCLTDRFVFLSLKTKMYFNAAVDEVAPQFFISSFHASKLILADRAKLSSLRKQWKDEPIEKMQKHFAKKWPHLVW